MQPAHNETNNSKAATSVGDVLHTAITGLSQTSKQTENKHHKMLKLELLNIDKLWTFWLMEGEIKNMLSIQHCD